MQQRISRRGEVRPGGVSGEEPANAVGTREAPTASRFISGPHVFTRLISAGPHEVVNRRRERLTIF
jgi:hypothetical protein